MKFSSLACWKPSGIRFTFCALIATASLAASADPSMLEQLQRMGKYAASYERHTNAEMNDIVFAGIHSDDEALVRHTVENLTWELVMVEGRRDQIENAANAERAAALRDGIHRTRDFAAVPGLRDFLLDYVRRGVAKDGWQSVFAPDKDMAEQPLWGIVPGVHTLYFPADPELEKLLIEAYRALRHESPDAAGYVLHLLNVGRFASVELEATRIEALEHPAAWVAASAAAGLGASLTDEGLAALGASLGRRDEALGEIVLAVLAHGARAKPYLPVLRQLHALEEELAPFLTPLPIYPNGVFHSLDRVEMLASHDAFPGPESPNRVHLLDEFIADQARYSDEQVNDIVFEGIHSGDPAAIARTVEAIGRATVANGLRDWLSAHAGRQVASPGNALDEQTRSFHKVLGLRDFLLAYVRGGLAEDGVAAFSARTSEARKPAAWTFGCHTLAVLFPGDREVRRVLVRLHDEFQRAGRGVNGPLRMLNAGRFHGGDVDALRTAALEDADPLAAQAAAQGLAMTLTDAGLRALAGALERPDAALADIAEAIGRFGTRALPHRARLRELANRGGVSSAAVEDSLAKVAADMGVIAAARPRQSRDAGAQRTTP